MAFRRNQIYGATAATIAAIGYQGQQFYLNQGEDEEEESKKKKGRSVDSLVKLFEDLGSVRGELTKSQAAILNALSYKNRDEIPRKIGNLSYLSNLSNGEFLTFQSDEQSLDGRRSAGKFYIAIRGVTNLTELAKTLPIGVHDGLAALTDTYSNVKNEIQKIHRVGGTVSLVGHSRGGVIAESLVKDEEIQGAVRSVQLFNALTSFVSPQNVPDNVAIHRYNVDGDWITNHENEQVWDVRKGSGHGIDQFIPFANPLHPQAGVEAELNEESRGVGDILPRETPQLSTIQHPSMFQRAVEVFDRYVVQDLKSMKENSAGQVHRDRGIFESGGVSTFPPQPPPTLGGLEPDPTTTPFPQPTILPQPTIGAGNTNPNQNANANPNQNVNPNQNANQNPYTDQNPPQQQVDHMDEREEEGMVKNMDEKEEEEEEEEEQNEEMIEPEKNSHMEEMDKEVDMQETNPGILFGEDDESFIPHRERKMTAAQFKAVKTKEIKQEFKARKAEAKRSINSRYVGKLSSKLSQEKRAEIKQMQEGYDEMQDKALKQIPIMYQEYIETTQGVDELTDMFSNIERGEQREDEYHWIQDEVIRQQAEMEMNENVVEELTLIQNGRHPHYQDIQDRNRDLAHTQRQIEEENEAAVLGGGWDPVEGVEEEGEMSGEVNAQSQQMSNRPNRSEKEMLRNTPYSEMPPGTSYELYERARKAKLLPQLIWHLDPQKDFSLNREHLLRLRNAHTDVNKYVFGLNQLVDTKALSFFSKETDEFNETQAQRNVHINHHTTSAQSRRIS